MKMSTRPVATWRSSTSQVQATAKQTHTEPRASARHIRKNLAKITGDLSLEPLGARFPFCLRVQFMNPLCLASSSTRASVASSVNHFKSRWGTRRLHQRQPLPYPVEKGLGNFLPPKALKVQLDYQDGLLERLNEQVVGMCLHSLYSS